MKEIKRIYFDPNSGFPNIPILETVDGETMIPYFRPGGIITWDTAKNGRREFEKWQAELAKEMARPWWKKFLRIE